MKNRLQGDGKTNEAASLIDRLPLISCVMVAGSRPEFVLQAAEYFRRQDYPERELLVIDDGNWDFSSKLPGDPRIRYMRLPPGLTEEQKLKYGYEQARGDVLANWDRDDWQAGERLSFQVAPILTGSADLTGLATPDFLDPNTGVYWNCSPKAHSRMFAHGVNPRTLLFRAETWRKHSQGNVWNVFAETAESGRRLSRLQNENLYIAVMRASENAGTGGEGWKLRTNPIPVVADIKFYEGQRRRIAAPPPSSVHPHGVVAHPARQTRQPLVSCIMPTANRRAFVPHAIRYFLNQDYPNRELIVMDDGADPIGDLIPGDPRIRYFRLEGTRSLGVKRNLACEQARGEVILHWDDDDWMASWRISYQVHHLMEADADICGIARMYFFAPHREQAWLYVFPEEARPWVGGGSLCYTKAIWREDPFRDVTIGEDNQFLQGEHPKRVAVLEDPRFYVALVHPENTSPKVTEDSRWQPRPAMEMRQILGADWSVYWPDAVPPGRENREPEADGQQRPGSAMVVARKADLRLPEFRTFNHGQSLPRMRQWELPFALFAARLEPAMTVLDCTINPVNFGERLNHLYPHVLYRHVNVFAGGTFCFPWGIPDNAFDRIFCINTLEHLPPALRQPTIEELSRKLKVGGRMILISDHSFDSQGNGPECASFEEWTRMCRASGLRPATRGRAPALPTAGDAWSYKNLPPYSHGTVAGVFAKGKQRAPRPRRVVLGLLTWNTREVSLESVHAYVQEAHMLRRLGVDAAICVCDNGSTDGTQDALRALDGETTEEHAFLLNGHNRGNSIARNQIIDYALQWNADYVLLMDGDIEVVPFSSFAMMRYLDDAGHRVGCIGPDSAGYTGTREDAAPCLYSLAGSRVETTERVAWTQYGMFRCAMFREGIRFDESGPFAGPGWGCEDDDLIYQIISRSYLCQRFFGMTYLHRAMHSSVRHLQDSGADVSELFEQRRQYVIAKWSSVPRINHGPLEALRGVRINFAPRPALEPRWRRVLSGVRQELKNIYGEDHHYTKDYSRCEEGFWAHIPGWLEEAGRRSKPSLVLDIGAAYGTLAALCTQLFNCRAHCTDVVPFMSADVARIHDLTIHFPLNVETSPLPKGSFDIVLLTETLEHFNYHPLPTLRKIRKALAKDGRLFLTTPDAATWGRAAQYYASLAEIPKPPKRRPESWIDDHIWQYTRDELMEVIGKAGFVVEREAMSSNGIATHFNLELRAAVSGNTRSSA